MLYACVVWELDIFLTDVIPCFYTDIVHFISFFVPAPGIVFFYVYDNQCLKAVADLNC